MCAGSHESDRRPRKDDATSVDAGRGGAMVADRGGRARRHRRWPSVVAGGCLGLLPMAAGATADAAASPLTYHVKGLIAARSDGTVGVSGDFLGTYRSIWQS